MPLVGRGQMCVPPRGIGRLLQCVRIAQIAHFQLLYREAWVTSEVHYQRDKFLPTLKGSVRATLFVRTVAGT